MVCSVIQAQYFLAKYINLVLYDFLKLVQVYKVTSQLDIYTPHKMNPPVYHPSDITHSYCNTTDYNSNKNVFIFTEFLLWYVQFLWFRCVILFKFWNNLMSWVLCLWSFLWMNRLRHEEVKELDQSLLICEELASESRLFDSRVPLFINILCHLLAVGKLGTRRINSFQDRRSMFFNFLLSRPTEGSQWFFK